jgi:uncharacterized protein
MRYRRPVTEAAEAAPTGEPVDAPLPARERVPALDVLRGFALLGIFIMNMPGFTHSLFAAPKAEPDGLDAVAAALRDLFFAGKFNLLFGLLFGVGFALQMARLERAESARAARAGRACDRDRPAHVFARRLVFLLAVGLVHVAVFWPGDVLVVYAVLGFALLAARRLSDRALLALLAACLVLPAAIEAVRPLLFSNAADAVAAFQYQELQASNDLAFGRGTFLDAALETARLFAWSYTSPLGLYSYAAFYVQMATGILAGVLLGRHDWPRSVSLGDASLARLQWSAALFALVATSLSLVLLDVGGGAVEAAGAVFAGVLARTWGRAALSAFYALTILRLTRGGDLPRWLRPLALAGRMPLTNYLMQTALATFIFYGWGLGLWGRVGPAAESLVAIVLFLVVQLPLSAWWLARHPMGPLESAWRRFTYARSKP